eukprot:COSAG02_NODE_55927_length_288_cov_0.608466_1_plen_22_part_10
MLFLLLLLYSGGYGADYAINLA